MQLQHKWRKKMAIKSKHNYQLDLFAWSDSQLSYSEVAIPSRVAILVQVIYARLRFQERTGAFVKSFVSGDFRVPSDAGHVIAISDYRLSTGMDDDSNWRAAYGQ